MFDVADAIEAAAGSELIAPHQRFATPLASARAFERTRRQLLRFLENVPDELCVLELRRAIDEMDGIPSN